MALKLEHVCTRCTRTVQTEVQDVKAATASEAHDAKRAVVLKDIEEFFATISPDLLPDLFIARRNQEPVAQMFLCDEAKRSCTKRVNDVVNDCKTFDPRKPRTKKAAATPAAEK